MDVEEGGQVARVYCHLHQARVDNADDLINHLYLDMTRDILHQVALRQPSLILDIGERVQAQQQQLRVPGPTTPPQPQQPNPFWCVCHRCREMPTDVEKLCCNMDPENCVSRLPDVGLFTLERGRLHLHQLYYNAVYGQHGVNPDDDNKRFRHAAYRHFILWQYGRLGERNQRVIPSCVVWRIRDDFPSPAEVYTGYSNQRLF